MQNLLIFLSRNGVLILFILLELISLHLIVRYNNNQREIFLNSSSMFSGWVFNNTDKVLRFWNLQVEVDSLSIENARMRTTLDKALFEFDQKRDTVFDSIYRQEYRYIPARVINNSVNLPDNKLTINKGKNDGLKTGMGIITGQGIVGIIVNTSNNFAQALSLLNSQIRVSATHKNSGQFGTLMWENSDISKITLKDVPKFANVVKGDTIITNRYSSIFPEGIPIGVIDTFWIESGTSFYNIDIDLFINFGNLRQVHVVDYLFKDEQQQMQLDQ